MRAMAHGARAASAGLVGGAAVNHRLAELTRPELLERAGAGAIGLVPVGALEQHGEHLPIATDSMIVESVCLAAAERAGADVLVAPPLWTGFSPHHLRFGATISLRSETFASLVRDVVRTLREWLPRVVLVNGHGGNRGPLTTLAIEEGCPTVNYWELLGPDERLRFFQADSGSIGHAGQAETSFILALAPNLVRAPSSAFEPILPEDPALLVPEMGATGVLGDASAADARLGADFLAASAGALAAHLDQLPNPTNGGS
jgi:creatinine amidohydrolase